MVQVIRKYADLQESGSGVGSQLESDDNSDTVSQKLLSDDEDDVTLTDNTEGKIPCCW